MQVEPETETAKKRIEPIHEGRKAQNMCFFTIPSDKSENSDASPGDYVCHMHNRRGGGAYNNNGASAITNMRIQNSNIQYTCIK